MKIYFTHNRPQFDNLGNSMDSTSSFNEANVNQVTAVLQTPQSLHRSETNLQQSTISILSNKEKEIIPKKVNELKREGLLKRTPKENWKWAVKRINSKAKNVS